jgi:hypothetical protein
MMAADMARAFDMVMLARDCGIEPDEWQAKLLRERPKRALLNCSRQTGKTETAILLGLWTAIFEPGSLVLIVSPSQRQSGEVFRRLLVAPSKLKGAPSLVQESALRAQFNNASRVILCLAAKEPSAATAVLAWSFSTRQRRCPMICSRPSVQQWPPSTAR